MAKLLPDIIKNLFQSKKKESKFSLPENAFLQCSKCKQMIYRKKLEEHRGICPECGYHFRISNEKWISILLDKDSFKPLFEKYKTSDPLHFPGYTEKVQKLYDKEINEAITTGVGKINGVKVLIGIMNTAFIMGSMGSVVGERVTELFERGTEERLPVVILTRSGGARMQEGVISLMQMVKTSAAIKHFSDKKNLYIAFLTYPTTGGVSASFAMLGDIILAEPNALIGFAGPRVIQQTIKQNLPEGFQRSEFLLEKGFVDAIVERGEVKDMITQILEIHGY